MPLPQPVSLAPCPYAHPWLGLPHPSQAIPQPLRPCPSQCLLPHSLTQPSTTLPALTSEVVAFLTTCMAAPFRASHAAAAVTEQDADLIKSMLSKTANTEDQVFAVFRGKIVGALSRLCRAPAGGAAVPLFASPMLQIVEGDVRSLGQQLRQVIANNTAVYSQFYYTMISELVLVVPEEGSSDEEVVVHAEPKVADQKVEQIAADDIDEL